MIILIYISSSSTVPVPVQSSDEVSQADSLTGDAEEQDVKQEEEEEEEEMLLMFDENSVGTSITINNNGTTASRDRDSFCNGVVFSKVSKIYIFVSTISKIFIKSILKVKV